MKTASKPSSNRSSMRLVFADVGVRDELDARPFELLPFFLPDILGKFEVGDAVDKQSARGGFGLEDGHFVPVLDELVGTAQTRRSCADDGNLLSRWACQPA